jgi:hypothetical protein
MKLKREITVNKRVERQWIDSSVRPGAPPAGFTHPSQTTPNPARPPQTQPVHPGQTTPNPGGRSTRADAADR